MEMLWIFAWKILRKQSLCQIIISYSEDFRSLWLAVNRMLDIHFFWIFIPHIYDNIYTPPEIASASLAFEWISYETKMKTN